MRKPAAPLLPVLKRSGAPHAAVSHLAAFADQMRSATPALHIMWDCGVKCQLSPGPGSPHAVLQITPWPCLVVWPAC